MKNLTSLTIGLVTAGLVHYAAPALALTWNFSYEPDPFLSMDPLGPPYPTQSGTFVAPGSESSGNHAITQFNFTHTDATINANFDTSGGSTFSTTGGFTNTVTIDSGGMITGISLLVNNPSGRSFTFDSAGAIFQSTIYDTVDAGGMTLDGSDGTGVNFTPVAGTGAGAPFDFDARPALLLLSILYGVRWLRRKLNSNKSRNSKDSQESEKSPASSQASSQQS